jgi:hypothetical protein
MFNRKSEAAKSEVATTAGTVATTVGTARSVAQNPQVRSLAAWLGRIGLQMRGRMARGETQRRAQRISDALLTARALIATYGPEAIEQLEQMGVLERPKPKRTAPRFLAGAVAGAGAMYLLEPRHRQQLQKLVSH